MKFMIDTENTPQGDLDDFTQRLGEKLESGYGCGYTEITEHKAARIGTEGKQEPSITINHPAGYTRKIWFLAEGQYCEHGRFTSFGPGVTFRRCLWFNFQISPVVYCQLHLTTIERYDPAANWVRGCNRNNSSRPEPIQVFGYVPTLRCSP